MKTGELLGNSHICFWSLQAIFPKAFFANGPEMVVNLVSSPSTCFFSCIVDGILYNLSAHSFTFLLGLPWPSQKVKRCNQYEIGVAFSRTMKGPFIFNNKFWPAPYFLLEFTCFLTIIICFCIKFPCGFAFVTQIPMSETPLRDQDV